MKLKLLLLTILTSHTLLFSQLETGAKVNTGISKITNSIGDAKVKYNFSGQVGAFFNVPLSKHLVLGVETNFNLIQGLETDKSKLTVASEGMVPGDIIVEEVGYTEQKVSRYIGYLSIPLFVGVRIKKMKINLGFQTSLKLFSGGESSGKGEAFGEPFEYNNTSDNLVIKKYDFGPKVSLSYMISEKMAIEGFYYYGLNRITEENSPFDWRVRQIAVGLLYGIPLDAKSEDK